MKIFMDFFTVQLIFNHNSFEKIFFHVYLIKQYFVLLDLLQVWTILTKMYFIY